MESLADTLQSIRSVDRAIDPQIVAHLNNLTKPLGSLGRLEEIAAKYADQGVRVIGVDANRQDSAEEFLAAARETGVTFPLVMDPRQRIARALGATRTGGVVVVDQIGHVAYAGRPLQSRPTETSTRPPSGVNFSAFPTMFSRA